MDERESIISSINTLLTEMERTELKFILQQAEILEFNRKVRLKRAETKETKAEGEAGSEVKPDQSPVFIEQTERSKYFNICIGTARLFIDYQEIQALFKIARAASSAEEAAPRLYRWFKRERSDVLSEGNIRGATSIVLYEIYDALLETFTQS